MVEGLLLSLWIAGGLFKLVLCESVLMDGRFGGGVGWCMLGSVWMVGGLVELGVTVLVVAVVEIGDSGGLLFDDVGWFMLVSL